MISKHISIDEEYFDRIKPYIERHNGNLGAALREIINQVDMYGNYTTVDTFLSDWIIKESEGRIIPDVVIDEILDPRLINSMTKLDEFLNEIFSTSDWNININLEADSDTLPSNVLADIRGPSSKINIAAGIVSKYIIKHSSERSPLGIKSLDKFEESMRIEFCMMDKKSCTESLFTYFGYIDQILKIIKEKPIFWKSIINRHVTSNYNMVTIHKNHFEELLANHLPALGEVTIEILSKNAIRDIPINQLLLLIKNIYESSKIVDKVEIDKNDMMIYHSYRNPKAIDKLKEIVVALLENGGHLYDAKSTSNMIILRYRPDIEIKLDQIIKNLKNDNNMDQELAKFIICLNGIKNMSDMSLYLTYLGRKIGKSLIQEYEIEHNKNNRQNLQNQKWDIDNFKTFIEIIDAKLIRESEWKLENGYATYIVKKCNIAKDDYYICHTLREMFKSALEHAFGTNVKIEIKELSSHGDNVCEVIIRIK